MDEPRVMSARRRLFGGMATAALVFFIGAFAWLYHLALRDAAFLTGWLLAAGMILLTLFNLRKKLPVIPLFDASLWLDVHLCIGAVAAALFLFHTEFRWPTGGFETLLWILFVAQTALGAVGLALSRFVPPYLTRAGERVLFERIPIFRKQLADRVQALVSRSVEASETAFMADYYERKLSPFMAANRNFPYPLRDSLRVSELHRELTSLCRDLDEEGGAVVGEIRSIVDLKHNLDVQRFWGSVLKNWLLLHVMLTWALLVFSAVHVMLVYSFGAGTL